jgi:hypothetical protein
MRSNASTAIKPLGFPPIIELRGIHMKFRDQVLRVLPIAVMMCSLLSAAVQAQFSQQATLMSVFARCRRVNWWLASKRLFWALAGRAGGAVVETTVDHTLMRGLGPHDR